MRLQWVQKQDIRSVCDTIGDPKGQSYASRDHAKGEDHPQNVSLHVLGAALELTAT